jgi:hypothetical protein
MVNETSGFWSTVRWPVGQLTMLLVVCAGVGAVVFFRKEPVYGSEAYSAATVIGLSSVVLFLWAGTRVVIAWMEIPSRWRIMRWFKAAIRFCFFGPNPTE